MSVLKDFGLFCSAPSKPPLREREVDDCGTFGVFWYRRPTGHTKTGARHRGETQTVVQWSFVRRSPDGGSWMVGHAIPGFATREAAVAAAQKEVDKS